MQVPSIFSHLRHFVRQERRFVARQAVFFAAVVSKQLLFRGETRLSSSQAHRTGRQMGAETRLYAPKLLTVKADGGGNTPLCPQVVQRWSGRRQNRCCIAKGAPFRPCSHCQKDLSAERKRSDLPAVHRRSVLVYRKRSDLPAVHQGGGLVYEK